MSGWGVCGDLLLFLQHTVGQRWCRKWEGWSCGEDQQADVDTQSVLGAVFIANRYKGLPTSPGGGKGDRDVSPPCACLVDVASKGESCEKDWRMVKQSEPDMIVELLKLFCMQPSSWMVRRNSTSPFSRV